MINLDVAIHLHASDGIIAADHELDGKPYVQLNLGRSAVVFINARAQLETIIRELDAVKDKLK